MTKFADVLTMEYMSSDESEMDEKTHGHGVKQYNLRKFTWESGDLKRAKRKLDKSHQDSLRGQSKRVLIPREQGEPSSTPNQPTVQIGHIWLKMEQRKSQMLPQIRH